MRIKTQRETFAYRVADSNPFMPDKKKKYFELGSDPTINKEKNLNALPQGDSAAGYNNAQAAGTKGGPVSVVPGSVGGGYGGAGKWPGQSGYSSGGSSAGSNGSGSYGGGYTPSQGVEQWRDEALEALRRNGLPESYADQVLHQIQTESSGNPKAINNYDSNAQAGHPSQGLLQTIPSTFQQYKLPGDSNDITDPQANLDAAIGYAKSRYGPTLMDSNGNGLGSGHGY